LRGDFGELRSGRDEAPDVVEAIVGGLGGLFAIALVWIVYSVVRGLWAFFEWASAHGNWYVAVGSASVICFGAVAAWTFVRWPRVFGVVELLVSASLGAYFGHRLTTPPVHVLEQVANIVGAVFLFADGIRTIHHARTRVR
jgi:hypothetical protein